MHVKIKVKGYIFLNLNEPLALELKNAMEKVTSLTGLTNKGDAWLYALAGCPI